MKKTWQLKHPIEAIIFDCDGTLTSIEGIDELAKINGVGDVIQEMTAQAMNTTGINPDIYQTRLDLIYPTKKQVFELGIEYYRRVTPDVLSIIKLFTRLNKKIYLISSGLYPAVAIFAELLTIPLANIFAVDVMFDENDNFLRYDASSPLVQKDGKRIIVTELIKQHRGIVYIGDGINDYVVHDLVTRFIGYGGAFYRENIYQSCQFYIAAESILPLLPLCLIEEEVDALFPHEIDLYHRGLQILRSEKVKK